MLIVRKKIAPHKMNDEIFAARIISTENVK